MSEYGDTLPAPHPAQIPAEHRAHVAAVVDFDAAGMRINGTPFAHDRGADFLAGWGKALAV